MPLIATLANDDISNHYTLTLILYSYF